MAAKMNEFYKTAETLGGLKARTQLSILTSVDSYQAKTLPDSEESIKLFESAMKKIVKEFNNENQENSLKLKVLKLLMIA